MDQWHIGAEHLRAAQEIVNRHARRTPLRAFPELGDGVYLKLECEQDTGSFKLRGALAALASLEPGVAEVVTASAGNHGYGMARAGAILGVTVRVFVSEHAPASKREGIAAAGATLEVVPERSYDAVEKRALEWSWERGARFVSPFDDPVVAAGNGGTIAHEILEDLPEVATIVAPVGGGGLVAGLAAGLRRREVALVGVQSEACPAMVESFALRRPLLTYEGAPTLAEGLEGGVSVSTFNIAFTHLARMDAVPEAAIARAMERCRGLGVVLEGSAAVTVAWLEAHRGEVSGPIVAIASGGNV